MNIPSSFQYILLNEEAAEIMRNITAKFREDRPGAMPPDELVFRDVEGGTEVLHGPKAVAFLDHAMQPGESYSDVIVRLHSKRAKEKVTLQ